MPTTRLAPSPTGALHLGNLRTFALTWLAARARGAGLLVRVEDIDGPRKKADATAQALQDLAWLGFDHDGEVVLQSDRTPDHLAAYEALMDDIGLATEQVAYVGDDVVDLPIMTRVGFAIAVQDAHPYVKKHAHWITQNNGGQGAVRDVCELILEARGLLTQALE